MKFKPKSLLGLLLTLIVIIAAASIVVKTSQKSTSFAEIKAEDNKFQLSFNLSSNDKNNIEKTLAQNVGTDGTYGFKLDSTSSAKLALLTPIKVNLGTTSHQIKFNGTVDLTASSNLQKEEIKVPVDTNIKIAGSNLTNVLENTNYLSPQLLNWAKSNIKNSQFIAFFGDDFSYIWKDKDQDLMSIKNIYPKESIDDAYKEENMDNNTLFLLKVNDNSTLGVFKYKDFIYLNSSGDAAKKMYEIAQNKGEFQDFFDVNQKNFDFYLVFQNSKKYPISQNLINKLFVSQKETEAKQKFTDTLNKIEELNLALYGREFSGLINIK